MKKRVLVVLALLGTMLPVGGLFQAAVAGTGSSASCSDDPYPYAHYEIPLITSPITLTMEVPQGPDGDGTVYVRHVRLCYSTSPAGYGGDDITGGSVQVGYNWFDSEFVKVDCTPQSNPSALQVSCHSGSLGMTCVNGTCAGAWPGTMSSSQHQNGYTVTIPIAVCVVACTTISPTVETTGWLHVQGGPTGAPSGTSTGAGVGGVQLTYCSVTTGCVPLAGPLDLSAGIGASQPWAATRPGYPPVASQLCYNPSPVPDTCTSGAEAGWGGQVNAVVQIGSTTIPVTFDELSPYVCVDGNVVYQLVWGGTYCS
jgi:hypothetical protein